MILKSTETKSYYTQHAFTLGKAGTHLGPENSSLAGQIVFGSMNLSGDYRYYQESDQKNLIFSGKEENFKSTVFCESGGEEGIGSGEGKGTADHTGRKHQDLEYYLVLN